MFGRGHDRQCRQLATSAGNPGTTSAKPSSKPDRIQANASLTSAWGMGADALRRSVLEVLKAGKAGNLSATEVRGLAHR
jgi:hypothetical protein